MQQIRRKVVALLLVAAVVVQAGDPGNWPQGDQLNGEWFPSRSTHYGYTNAGACGHGTWANCWTGRQDAGCDTVPDAVKTPIGGLYAAPQGDYYAQVGNYVSCGECFEIRCDDPHCPAGHTITAFISDACPCLGNEKWCCNVPSKCDEMSTYPSLEGPPHCPSIKGPWTNHSIHLDLSDHAFALLEKGDRTLTPSEGFLNTFARRVSCPQYNNSIYLSFASGVPSISKSCVLGGNGSIKAPCFYFILFGLVGVGGSGAVARVQYLGQYSKDNVVHDGPYELQLINNPGNDLQGRYGGWTGEQGVALMFPFRLRFISRLGEVAESIDFTVDTMMALKVGAYLDTKAQFGWIAPPPLPKPSSSTAPAPAPVASTGSAPSIPTGPKPECWAAGVDEGSNDYWLSFYVSATGAHTIKSVTAVGNGVSYKLTGPFSWGPSAPTVYTSVTASPSPFNPPYVLRVVDSAGNVNDLVVNALGKEKATYTC